jgi:maltose alpha-D-glucosyltransferase/alpha-amylase
MHLALASDTTDAAFSPEPWSRADLEQLAEETSRQARQVLDAVTSLRTGLTDEVRSLADQLLQSKNTLVERIRTTPLVVEATKIRVHGDYHLGQVLWSESDFVIFDFEGEPTRPLEERRRKQSPLKDVAGMVRSFSYAAYAGLFAFTVARPTELDRLEKWARVWQLTTSAAFVRTYLETVAGAHFVPARDTDRDALLQLFVLDKAIYELNYELNNRPDWARIPLRGILDLLDGAR